MRLSSLTLLILAAASPVLAEDTAITGALSVSEKGTVLIKAGPNTYRVSGDAETSLRAIARTNPTQTPRTVTVEGEAGKARINAQGVMTRSLDAYALTSPRSITAEGVLSAHKGKTTILVEVGPAKGKHLTVTGVPTNLLTQMDQRKVVVAGWRFGQELQLTSAQASVVKEGFLSADKDPKTGKFPRVAEVAAGDPVQVLELAAYRKSDRTMRPLADMAEGDLLFARVGAGRSRGEGGHAFVGWIPAYKLSFGEKVKKLPEQQSLSGMPPQATPKKEAEKDGATKKVEQAF